MKSYLKYLIRSCLLLIMLSSCSDNNIYFDTNNQSIRTCNGRIIRSLSISSIDSEDYYVFTKLPKKNGTNKFSLVKLNQEYILEDMNGRISFGNFKLRPETRYEIINSTYGDAQHSRIIIKTNRKGMIIFSNKTSCE